MTRPPVSYDSLWREVDRLRAAIAEHRTATIYGPRKHSINENPMRPQDGRLWLALTTTVDDDTEHEAPR